MAVRKKKMEAESVIQYMAYEEQEILDLQTMS